MFNLFRPKEAPERKEFRETFMRYATNLRNSDETVQALVGHAINMANSLFFRTYSDIAEFESQPKSAQLDYINKLSVMEKKLDKSEPVLALGFGLFKMWIAAVVDDDQELMEEFFVELSYFSKKGNLPPDVQSTVNVKQPPSDTSTTTTTLNVEKVRESLKNYPKNKTNWDALEDGVEDKLKDLVEKKRQQEATGHKVNRQGSLSELYESMEEYTEQTQTQALRRALKLKRQKEQNKN